MNHAPLPPTCPPRLRRAKGRVPTPMWGWLLAVLLALGPMLGAMHGVVHPGRGAPSASVVVDGPDFNPVRLAASSAFFEQIFGHHDDDADDCRLYDQLCGAPGMRSAVALFVPPQVPVAAVPAWHHEDPAFAAASYFEARGPPPIR